jgi:hypothetical protein
MRGCVGIVTPIRQYRIRKERSVLCGKPHTLFTFAVLRLFDHLFNKCRFTQSDPQLLGT